jgi:hypothetical protein
MHRSMHRLTGPGPRAKLRKMGGFVLAYRMTRLLAVLLPACALAALPFAGCGDDASTADDGATDERGGDESGADADADGDGGADADADADSDADADADVDAHADTDADPDGDAAELCPPAADPDLHEMRLRDPSFEAPAAFTGSAVLSELFRQMAEDEGLLWLLRFTRTTGGPIVLRTGSGLRVAGTGCTYRYMGPEYPPGELTIAESSPSLHFLTSGAPIARLDIPMWVDGAAYPDPPWLVLPLRELTIGGTFSADHLNVGGTISAKITADDALGVWIETLGMTLCGMLSGDSGAWGDPSDDCASDPSTWMHPPDATVGTSPAWTMRLGLSGSPVHIEGD